MKIIVLPKNQAEKFNCDEPWAAISISGKYDFPAEISDTNRVGLLRLEFDDVDRQLKNSFKPYQALEIINFAKEFIPKINTMMIHCNMGMSRSPAVAAAIQKLLTNDDNIYFKCYTPNRLVYSTIMRVASSRLHIIPGEFLP